MYLLDCRYLGLPVTAVQQDSSKGVSSYGMNMIYKKLSREMSSGWVRCWVLYSAGGVQLGVILRRSRLVGCCFPYCTVGADALRVSITYFGICLTTATVQQYIKQYFEVIIFRTRYIPAHTIQVTAV